MLAAVQFIATFCAMLFAGAAVYINLVEHPARMECGTRMAATVWAPSYKRAVPMQASLAIVSCIAGAAAWFMSANLLWLFAALLIGAVVPVTFLVILPVNKQLMAPQRNLDSSETRQLLARWGTLHGIRSVLSLLASLLYLALLQQT